MADLRAGAAIVALAALGGGCGAPERDCAVELWYLGAAEDVRVVGDFNGWNGTSDPMVEVEPGAWRAELDLGGGEYRYMLEVDGAWIRDPFAPLMAFEDPVGQERSLLRVDACDAPELAVSTATASASGDVRIEAAFLRAPGGPRLDVSSVAATWSDGSDAPVESSASSGSLSLSAAGLPPGKHTVTLTAADRAGASASARVSLWVEESPFVWEDALIYQVVLDRFAGPGGAELAPDGWAADEISARFGGTLSGVTAKIEDGWFDELGVNALWLSPVVQNADGMWPGVDGREYSSYHGYWPISVDGVEPNLGTADDLDALVAAAHTRGIRVLLDVVPNHVHEDHPYRAEHPEWFHADASCVCGSYTCPWNGNIESCWFTEYLPDFDWGVPGVPDRIASDVIAWAERYDLDGYRVDAVPMLPRSAVRFLVYEARRRLEAGGQRFYTLGETFTGPTGVDDIRANLGPFGLDGQFEFPMLWSLRDFAAGYGTASDLDAILRESEAAWDGSGSVMAPIVGNHDMDRLTSVVAGDWTGDAWEAPPPQPEDAEAYERALIAQAISLTLPGAPVIYYGDELGLAGAGDPDCRRPMPWTGWLPEQQALLGQVRRLGAARQCASSLRRGDRQTLLVDGPVYAYLRDDGLGAPAIVVINASDDPVTADVRVPEGASLPAGTPLVDVVGAVQTATAGAGDTLALDLPARTARVFLPAALGCVPGVAP